MAPRKRKSSPIGEVVAVNVKRLRESKDWTQAQLGDEMKAIGFVSWARMTVTEVEGTRRRPVSVSELLGLAQVFGIGVEELLWDSESNLPLEVTETHVLLERHDLLEMLIQPDVMAGEAMRVVRPALEEEIRKLYEMYVERVQFIAKELRDTAGYFEEDALKRLRTIGEQSS